MKCDLCGKFVSYEDIGSGEATHKMVTPDSEFTEETYHTLCKKCLNKEIAVVRPTQTIAVIGSNPCMHLA